MERRVASDILLNAFHERYSPFEKCAVKFSTVARIVRAEVIAGIEDFSIEGQEKVVMDWIAEKGYHTGNIMNAFRLTLVGEGKGPHMFDISWVLGKEETIARMKRAVEVLK